MEELAEKCAIEPGQLCGLAILCTLLYLVIFLRTAQVLRLLSAQGIFKEVAPDIFANNRLSTVLDKGLSSNDLDAVDRVSPRRVNHRLFEENILTSIDDTATTNCTRIPRALLAPFSVTRTHFSDSHQIFKFDLFVSIELKGWTNAPKQPVTSTKQYPID